MIFTKLCDSSVAMVKELPSLNSIRFFESAARLSSFTKAGEELHVTQGAVSRQIKTLEEQLGCQLFLRSGPHLTLTSHGEQMQTSVTAALEILKRGINNLREQESSKLCISVLPSFANHWLVPRMGDFEDSHPQYSIRLSSSYHYVDLKKNNDIDLAIRIGAGDWPGCFVERLTDDLMFPVCAPDIAAKIRTIDDLRQQTILVDAAPFDEWTYWFEAQQHPYQVANKKFYDDVGTQISGAVEGQGVSLVREALVRKDIQDGRLVSLFDNGYHSSQHYYFVCAEERVAEEKIVAFKEWIFAAINKL